MSNAHRLTKAFAGITLAAAAMIATSASPSEAAITAPVHVKTGLLTGTPGRDPSITIYKGIPYAAPPVGDLRWRAPQPAASWQGVRKADQFASPCLQSSRNKVVGVEDCLFLNVWTGAASPKERRPVIFFSYEGGFQGNDSANPLWEGEGLAKKGVIVVTFNYRAGVMGFLATPELSKESGHNASGNYGMLDQIAALKWVHDNIAAFGGDPNRVTIAGQSAGGLSTLILMQSPLAKGLYQRAIMESRARGLTPTMKEAEAEGTAYLQGLGSPSLQELRAMPTDKLKAKDPFNRPVVDGWVIPTDFYQMFAKGLQHNVPVLMGTNKDESGSHTHPSTTVDKFKEAAQQHFGDQSATFLSLYPVATDAEAGLAQNTAAKDDGWVTDFLLATQGPHATANKTFIYFWTHVPPGPDADREGAFHGSELNYVFDNLYATDRPWTDQDRQIADTMSSYWANFAADGDPNGKGLPEWRATSAANPTVMEVGDRFGSMPITAGARKAFLTRFYVADGMRQPWR